MSDVFVATLGVVVQINIITLGFEVSLKICLLGSSVVLEHLGKMKATPIPSLSFCIVDRTIGINLIDMFAQCRIERLYITFRYLASEISAYLRLILLDPRALPCQ